MADEYLAEQFEHNGYNIKIVQDTDAPDPRKEQDNVGRMVCFHRRYDLGDETRREGPYEFIEQLALDYDAEFVNRWDNAVYRKMVTVEPTDQESVRAYTEQVKAWKKARHAALWKVIEAHYIMLPLGLIDHSGISMYIGSGAHSCDPGGWDSGQIGWIYCAREKAIEEWGGKRFTKHVREMADKCLRAEVKGYDQFLTGDVYGYVIETPDGEQLDSCWGFFGLEYCKEEAKSNCPSKPAPKRTPEQLTARFWELVKPDRKIIGKLLGYLGKRELRQLVEEMEK